MLPSTVAIALFLPWSSAVAILAAPRRAKGQPVLDREVEHRRHADPERRGDQIVDDSHADDKDELADDERARDREVEGEPAAAQPARR
jgi:hypothetical protein